MRNDVETLSFGSSVDAIRAELPPYLQSPRVGIVCGSDLSGMVVMFH